MDSTLIRVSFQFTENKMFRVIVLSFSSNSATSMTFTTDLKVTQCSKTVMTWSHKCKEDLIDIYSKPEVFILLEKSVSVV